MEARPQLVPAAISATAIVAPPVRTGAASASAPVSRSALLGVAVVIALFSAAGLWLYSLDPALPASDALEVARPISRPVPRVAAAPSPAPEPAKNPVAVVEPVVVAEPAAVGEPVARPAPVVAAPVPLPIAVPAGPIPRPTKARSVKVVEAARRWLAMADGCEPDKTWRADAIMTLRELGEVAAGDVTGWVEYQKREPALTRAINGASGSASCGRVSQQLGELTIAIIKQ